MSVLEILPAGARRSLRRRRQPEWMNPMLATLTDEPFSDPKWLYERKLDGERALAFRRGRDVQLMSRNRKLINRSYPELVDALLAQDAEDFVVDGEIVTFDRGLTSFARLQRRMHVQSPAEALRTGVPVYYYLFDLLYVDGFDTTHLPLRHRKALLRRLVSFRRPLRYSPHRLAEGEALYREACRRGLEGLIAKRADARYVHARSTDWLKFKCVNEQEFVVGGYTDPQGTRAAFGALVIGYHERGKLRYAGKVGTGYDEETLRRLYKRLAPLKRDESPFASDGAPKGRVHWVRPRVVVQVGFTEWTSEGRLRHPRYLGERRDKKPEQVVRERSR